MADLTLGERRGLAALSVLALAGVVWTARHSLSPIGIEEGALRPPPYRVPINTAGPEELGLITGVGEKTAQTIIEAREKDGPIRDMAALRKITWRVKAEAESQIDFRVPEETHGANTHR